MKITLIYFHLCVAERQSVEIRDVRILALATTDPESGL